MGFFGRLLGIEDESDRSRARAPIPGTANAGAANAADGPLNDAQALERYRYMLRTAPPETLEQAHAEAFAQLTPEQRQMVLAELSAELPERERIAAERAGDDPRALARTATRAEMR